jgi:endonuclease/exonuclease/phosphatase family metal-dependent hydrolase
MYTKEQVDEKVQWIGAMLKRMKASIVGFEEVFHVEPLKRAVEASGFYPTAEIVTCNCTGNKPNVALLTTFPVVEKEIVEDFPPESKLELNGLPIPVNKFQRPILRVVVKLPTGLDICVMVAHMKSKRPLVDDTKRQDQKCAAVGEALSTILRAAEASALRCLIVSELEQHPDRPFVLLGDLNDSTRAVTTSIISGSRPWKRLPQVQKQKIWNSLLYSTNDFQVRNSDRDVYYTHIHNGNYECLDHVYVSNHFIRTNPNNIAYIKYLQMYNDHLVDETISDEKQSVTESDHGQVVAVLRFFSKHGAKDELEDD